MKTYDNSRTLEYLLQSVDTVFNVKLSFESELDIEDGIYRDCGRRASGLHSHAEHQWH